MGISVAATIVYGREYLKSYNTPVGDSTLEAIMVSHGGTMRNQSSRCENPVFSGVIEYV